ncbi:hypothetical protein LPJ61_001637 [Coemansia biformis]|uniref:MFS general substrate transporter n=1 Tax=Coemansia biformis TaxID=1286918 RepID=A0A9W7Y9N7_9FUNG|nr:hypothetical protein LPJ61_001637 [Coemansia biformis]
MCTLGICNSFGVFATHYINHIYPEESAADIAWIGTMLSGMGGILLSELSQKLMVSVGHQWALRVLALVVFCVSGASGALYRRRLPALQGGVRFVAIARDHRLVAIGVAGFFVNIGYYVPWYYLPTAALKAGQTSQAANSLVVYMNAGSTAGRILVAYATRFVGPINSMVVAHIACSALIPVAMLAARHMASYAALAVTYGMLSASSMSVVPIILADTFGLHATTTAVGIVNSWCAMGVLVGNPSQGAIYQKYDRPRDSFTLISAWGFAGIFLAACSYLYLKVATIRGTTRRLWSVL